VQHRYLKSLKCQLLTNIWCTPPSPPHPTCSHVAPRLYIVLKLGQSSLAPDGRQDHLVLIGGHPYPIPALSTAYLQLL
jgi:hypothetical protein